VTERLDPCEPVRAECRKPTRRPVANATGRLVEIAGGWRCLNGSSGVHPFAPRQGQRSRRSGQPEGAVPVFWSVTSPFALPIKQRAASNERTLSAWETCLRPLGLRSWRSGRACPSPHGGHTRLYFGYENRDLGT
jgi:hypothetical protein